MDRGSSSGGACRARTERPPPCEGGALQTGDATRAAIVPGRGASLLALGPRWGPTRTGPWPVGAGDTAARGRRRQLLELGYGPRRSSTGRDGTSAPRHRGVTRLGGHSSPTWTLDGAVLSLRPGAAESRARRRSGDPACHTARSKYPVPVDVSLARRVSWSTGGLTPERLRGAMASRSRRPICTLIDLAASSAGAARGCRQRGGQADLTDPEELRRRSTRSTRRPGIGALRELSTAARSPSPTRSSSVASCRSSGAGLPEPQTGRPERLQGRLLLADLGLVVETDGLRYHRTPAQQAKIVSRPDHAAAGLDDAAVHPRTDQIRA